MKILVIGAIVVVAIAALLFHPSRDANIVPVTPSTTGSSVQTRRNPHPATEGAATAVVYVAGSVQHPGLYRVPANARANDALARAGGPKPDADLVAVNLAAHIADGDEIVIPAIGETAPRSRADAHGTRSSSHKRHKRKQQPVMPVATESSASVDDATAVDLNTAGVDDLATLPGIGAGLAQRIVIYRETNGPFTSIDELSDVAGMTPSRIDEVTPYLVVRQTPAPAPTRE
jgi:competence protein ComEA